MGWGQAGSRGAHPATGAKAHGTCQDSFRKAFQEKMGGLHQNLQRRLVYLGSAAAPQPSHLTPPRQWLWGAACGRGWVDKSHGTRAHCCSRAECLSTMPPGEVRAVCCATAGVPRICPVPAATPPPPSLKSFDAAHKIPSLAWQEAAASPAPTWDPRDRRAPSKPLRCHGL